MVIASARRSGSPGSIPGSGKHYHWLIFVVLWISYKVRWVGSQNDLKYRSSVKCPSGSVVVVHPHVISSYDGGGTSSNLVSDIASYEHL